MKRTLRRLLAILLSMLVLTLIDWKTGYEFDFFVFYFLPVGMTAWFFGVEWSVLVSITCAFLWFVADMLSGNIYSSSVLAVWNSLILLVSFLLVSWAVNKIHVLLQSENRKSANLEKALSKIKILENFLSICCVCHKIRDEQGHWQQMESYISEHSETRFSHGFCPECAKKAMEEIDQMDR
jgi:hypothetical protein